MRFSAKIFFLAFLILSFSAEIKAEQIEDQNDWAPDFLMIGAQKAGTTALYHFIIQHPLVVKRTGEIHFFDVQFNRGIEWYKNQFPLRPSPQYVLGEKTPFYLFHPLAAQRVHALFPKVKIILLLRNPVDRAYSQYWYNVRMKRELLSFKEALGAEKERLADEKQQLLQNPLYKSYNFRHYSYLARGIYVDQIKSWLSLFPKEQLLILSSTDLRENPEKVLNKVFSFLEIHPYSVQVRNASKHSQYEPMDPTLRKQLSDYFEPYNRQLEKLLGRTFNWN
jgi:hypothetical protein